MTAFAITAASVFTILAVLVLCMIVGTLFEKDPDAGMLQRVVMFCFGPVFLVLAGLAAWGWWAVCHPDYARGYEAGMRHAGEMMGQPPVDKGDEPSPAFPPAPEDMPAFFGPLPGSRVDFDIVGEWDLMHYGTTEKPASKDGWKGSYTLERKPDENFVWQGKDGAFGEWALTTKPVAEGGQFLIWKQTWKSPIPRVVFSINEFSFGMLKLTDSETGELYLMIRREGGQDSPELAYPPAVSHFPKRQ